MDQNELESNNEMKQTDFVQLLKNWGRYFIKLWWGIILVGIIGAIGGFVYAHYQKINYESRLTFALDDNSGGGLSGAFSLASQFGLDLGGTKDIFSGDNIIYILKSRRIVENVLLSSDTIDGKVITMATEYIKLYEYEKGFMKAPRFNNINFPVGQPRASFTYLQDTVIYSIYNSIVEGNLFAQKPDKKLNIYELKFLSLNERFSKIFIEKLIKEATTFYTDLRSKHSKETLEVLEQRVAQLKGSVNSAITERAATQDANVNPAFAAAQAPLQRKQLDITVYGSAYGELYKSLELARYQYLKNIPLLQIIEDAQYPMKKVKAGRIKTGATTAAIAVFVLLGFLVVWRIFTKKETV